MSVKTLARYNVRRDFQDHYDDCKMIDNSPDGEFVKFQEAMEEEIKEVMEASSKKVQQLKIEIEACLKNAFSGPMGYGVVLTNSGYNKLRQLINS